jgi:tetratricopeptide (TPR) repeat protein
MRNEFKLLCAAAALVLVACDMVDVYEGQIESASRAIEAAKTDASRASAYSDRGRGYSNKARLSLLRNRIEHDEYVRLFDLAMKDHDQAVALDPGNADTYFERGLSNYDRAALAGEAGVDHAPWFDAARKDFKAAIQKDHAHQGATDYLGLVDEQTGRFEDAIADYTREMQLDPKLGRSRLAELYCVRGQSRVQEKMYDLAVADLEKSVEYTTGSDGCSCEPYNTLAWIYIDLQKQYDKGWDLVHRARNSNQLIASEYVERLKQGSGRNE